MEHIILVDYDNIPKQVQLKGLFYIADRLVRNLSPKEVNNNTNITIRLYGGWYIKNNITHKAQYLSSELANIFPNAFLLSDALTKVIVNVELAFSLISAPKYHLVSTFRIRGNQYNLKCLDPQKNGCTDIANCGIIDVFEFINGKVCKKCNVVTPDLIIYKEEQKLVDSMIISDMLYISFNSQSELSVVSSDDDIWPGIITALANNINVIHFQTKGKPTPVYYTNAVGKNYITKYLN